MHEFRASLTGLLFCLCLLCTPALFAQYTGTPIPMNGTVAVDAAGKQLKWEEGNHDYFIMFKSLLSISETCTEFNYDNPPKEVPCANPQADQCLPEATGSTYTLGAANIPPDAVVEAAYLVWTSAVSKSDFDAAMDNAVTLAFTQKDNAFTVDPLLVTASRAGKLSNVNNPTGDMAQDFQFEGFKLDSEGEALFTYRVDVTGFFADILQKGRDAGLASDGLSFLGDYTVSGLGCFTGYADAMVSNWSILFVYTSSAPGMKPKKIYVYNGLRYYVAEEAEVTVSGFTFPNDPSLRVSLMVSEGDSGKQMATYQGNPLPPEGLYFKGAGSSWDTLSNKCNPEKNEIVDEIMGSSTPYDYTEMFNSISSLFNWDQYTDPVCVGGMFENGALLPDQNTMEWAIDVDTFMLNAADHPSQLTAGGTSLSLKVNANADGVITNFLVVSVDTKPVAFDIPNAPEKTSCSCAQSAGQFCLTSDLFFLIRVQNWGQANATAVTVQDEIPSLVKYVPNTTEMATQFDAEGRGTDWAPITDGNGGTFPLATAYKVADSMKPCDAGTGACQDARLIRFKVRPQEGLPKNAVVSNIATIADASGILYKSNSSVPLVLRTDQYCDTGCQEPDLSTAACGGLPATVECDGKEDCAGDLICLNGHCVEPTDTDTAGTVDNSTGIDDDVSSDISGPDTDEIVMEEEPLGCGCSLI